MLMLNRLRALRHTHRFMARQLLYPILLCTWLAFGFYLGRVYLSHSGRHLFLMGNLFLAWIPYLCSLWVSALQARGWNRWWHYVIPTALWLLFFPNATYLIMDLYNLR